MKHLSSNQPIESWRVEIIRDKIRMSITLLKSAVCFLKNKKDITKEQEKQMTCYILINIF